MVYSQLLKKILDSAVEKHASDIHISVGHPPILRINGELFPLKESIIKANDSEGLARELMIESDWEKFLQEKEADFAYEFEKRIRLRGNIFFKMNSVSIALRLIDSKIKTIEELNLPPILRSFTEANQGFVLITGASSQGKSTSLAALVDEVNHKRREHIITIEDPIEFVFKDDKCLIEQREVGEDTLSFGNALRAALRQDPDVIMVGELRDLETISTAITAAETGHLVFATLHTNSASQTIHRIIDVFPSHQQNQISAQLAVSLLGVVSQRLLPRPKIGFIPACEVMLSTPAIANLIRENKIHELPSIIETSGKKGMITFNKSLEDLVRKKEISKEIAIKYSLNPQDLEARLEKL